VTLESQLEATASAPRHQPLKFVRMVQPHNGSAPFKGKSVARLAGQLLVISPTNGGLSPDELGAIRRLAAERKLEPATVGPQAQLNPGLRRARVAWVEHSAQTAWIFSRALAFGLFANRDVDWNFEIRGPAPALQLSRYDSADHGMFDWHMDTGAGGARYRKLAVVIVIEAAHEGGQLECRTGSAPRAVPMLPGAAVVFPAYLQHRITPVVRGSRLSLVSWLCGPPFR
jgi:PKHD-type hydroxylase